MKKWIPMFFFPLFLFAEEGLFRAKDSRVPGVIEIAGESVVQIVLLSPQGQKIPQKLYSSYLSANPGEDFIFFLTQKKIKECAERGQAYCEISYSSYGSAFVVEEGKALWTAKHVIEAQIGSKLLFELYNSDGEKIFDTTDSKDQASLAVLGQANLIQKRHPNYQLDTTLLSYTSDYAKLNLNQRLAIRSLKVSARKPALQTRVYTVGYANLRDRKLSSNSSIRTRSRVAMGLVSPYLNPGSNENAASKAMRAALEDFTSQHLIAMDLDGIHGQSGSPVLNESGEVVGIYIAGNRTNRGDAPLRGLAPHFEGIGLNGN